MILDNNNYVEGVEKSALERAVEQNSLLTWQDNSRWFYKRWRGLTEVAEDMDKLETKLQKHLRDELEQYKDSYEKGHCYYPTSVLFTKYKEELDREDNVLMTAFRKLPKCGLLHVHSAAALSVEGLLELLKVWSGPEIYIQTVGEKKGVMFYQSDLERERKEKTGKYGSESSVQPLQSFFGHGGEQHLKRWLTIGEHTNDVKYIWEEFNAIFLRTESLFSDKKFYYEYHYRFFLECLADRIDYVELRCGFQNFTNGAGSGGKDVVLDLSPEFLDQLIRAKDAAVQKYQETEDPGKWELPYGDMNLGVILCARRSLDAEDEKERTKLLKKIDTAIFWKEGSYGQLIKGFDFVSEEDKGQTSYSYYQKIFYGEIMSGYKKKSVEEQAFSMLKTPDLEKVCRVDKIDLMLHAGESLWMWKDNILDAKIASKSRIGHGFQMLVYPGALWEYLSESYNGMPKGPVLEVCPISNQMLRYFPDIRNHYALILMKMGVPCVISNDDPQILENPGLSYDFWEMYMASDGRLMLIKGLVFTAFVFQYQDRISKRLEKWGIGDYTACLDEFHAKYWTPYLEEMSLYFESR